MVCCMIAGRYSHGCVLLDENRILVVGGKDENANDLKSTEIIDLTNNTIVSERDLHHPRSEFGLIIDGSQNSHILAIGGDSNGSKLKSIEKWKKDQEKWEIMQNSLRKESSHFGYLSVAPKLLDPVFQGK